MSGLLPAFKPPFPTPIKTSIAEIITEVRRLLPELRLPETIKALWEEYFASKGQRDHN
jgi:hypothetical protein